MYEFVDRQTRLAVLGVLSLVVGGFSGLLALLMLVLPALSNMAAGYPTIQVSRRSILVQAFLCLSLGASFVWLGLGSMKARRWVRPLMLILAWTWLLTGVGAMALLFTMLDPLLGVAASEPELLPPELLFFVKVFVVAVMTVICLILPAVFVWGYTSRDIRRTCEVRNPVPSWTDRCPLLVLALSVGLGAGAYLALPWAAYAAVPAFGWMVRGWPAVLLMLLGGGVCAYLAWATYRLDPAGWWGSVVLFVGVGASFTITLLRVGLVEFYRALDYPEQQLEMMRGQAAWTTWLMGGMMLVFTVACVAYMLYIRKYFRYRGQPV